MLLSDRLSHVAKFIPECLCVADIGTDHAYIPIYAVENNLCEKAIACDIRKGPVKVAQANIIKYGFENKITTRVGSGLSVLQTGEADVVVIAGLGGNVITNILSDDLDKALSADCIIFQPVQYPEVLRRNLISLGFKIVDEDIVKDENKFYFIIKAESSKSQPYEKEVYYYTGTKLIGSGNPLLKEYCEYKLSVLNKIIKKLSPEEQNVRYNEVRTLIEQFKEVICACR